MYTLEVGRHLLVIDDGDDDDDDCRRVTMWQELFWDAICIDSFHFHSNLQSNRTIIHILQMREL